MTKRNTTIYSPMVFGNGAMVIHQQLAARIDGYLLEAVSPWAGLVPPYLQARLQPPRGARLIHSVPDVGAWYLDQGLPTVMSLQNYYCDQGARRFSTIQQYLYYRSILRKLYRRTMQAATIVTAVSHFTSALARRDLGVERSVTVIHNGVDTNRFYPGRSGNRAPRVLFVGNLTRRKGAHLIPAIRDRLDQGIELWVACGLRGGHAEPMRGVRSLGRVAWESMPELYRSVDLLIAPFEREGLCVTVLEAMASGLPVIAFDASSMPELIQHGSGGYLVGIDDLAGLVEAVEHVAESSALRREMGQFNRDRASEQFTEAGMTSRYQETFAAALGSDRQNHQT